MHSVKAHEAFSTIQDSEAPLLQKQQTEILQYLLAEDSTVRHHRRRRLGGCHSLALPSSSVLVLSVDFQDLSDQDCPLQTVGLSLLDVLVGRERGRVSTFL